MYPTRQVNASSTFYSHRDPSLDFGIKPNPIQNMTVLPNQLHRSLDLLAQTDQLTISNMHKNSNILDNSHIISSNDIDEALDKYQGVAQPHIPYGEYPNPSAYFDNFTGKGKTDIIKEYICHINSIDRDIKKYPNPFTFLVKLAPVAGDTDASISRTFTNIRYVKIETAVLPRRHFITKTELDSSDENIIKLFQEDTLPPDNSLVNINGKDKYVIIYSYTDKINSTQIINYTLYDSDISKVPNISYECIAKTETINPTYKTYKTYKYELSNISIECDKYTILYLNDINDVSQFSTDLALSKAFNVLYPDIIYGDSIYVDTRYADKIYKYSELGNMSRMNLILTNSLGKQLSTNIKAQDYNIPTINSTSCTCSTDSNGNIIRDYKCICCYIRHPRYIKIQIDLMFKFGIVETDFDKRVFN